MNNEIRRFGYEDTDKKIKIEIYGLEFEIKNIDVKREQELNKNDINVIEKEINNILGENAVNRLNDKRLQDGYSIMDLSVELNILGFIFSTYAECMTNGFMKNINNSMERMNNQVNNFTNRSQRRNYNRNYRGNRRY